MVCYFQGCEKSSSCWCNLSESSSSIALAQGRNFVVKCGGPPWGKTNIVLGPMRKWSFVNTDPILFFRGVFKATLITLYFVPANDLEINKPNFVVGHRTVVQLGCTTIRLRYKPAQHYSRTHQLGFLSELSVGVHKTVNRIIGLTCISLICRTHRFSCILEVWVTARFDVLFKLLNIKKTINCKVRYIYITRMRGMVAKYFSCLFPLVKNATNL